MSCQTALSIRLSEENVAIGTAGMAACRVMAMIWSCSSAARVVDLHVAEAEVGEGLEGLVAPGPHDVGGREVGLLGPVQGRDLPVGVEQVSRPHGDRGAVLSRSEIDPGASGVDGAEVRHDRAAGERVKADREDVDSRIVVRCT